LCDDALKLILNWGIEADEDRFGSVNPAARAKLLAEGPGYQPWPDNLIDDVQAKAYPELRWVFLGVLNTGQRGQDVVRMLWSHVEDGGIRVAQAKTGARLWLPMTEQLRRTFEAIPRRAAVIFTTKTGWPWSLPHLRHEAQRLGAGYWLYGLRHNAAERLAEAGCSEAQIMAITGHRTPAMVQRYTRRAGQKRLAKAAIERLEKNETSAKMENSGAESGKPRQDA
jgi:integrase